MGERGRHDLTRLFRSGLEAQVNERWVVSERSGARLSADRERAAIDASRKRGRWLAEAQARWRNSYRYYPTSSMAREIKKSENLRRGGKGDIAKFSVNKLLDIAQSFLALGENEWRLHFKNG